MLALMVFLFFFQANVTKRISIVTVSIILIGNQVTASNVCGMLMAILGVFYYNKVKYEENKARSTLPTTMTPSSGGVEKKGGSILWQNQRGVAEDAQHVKLITSRAPSQHVRIISGRALAVWQVWQLPYQYFGILPHQNSFYKLIFNRIGKTQRSVAAGDL